MGKRLGAATHTVRAPFGITSYSNDISGIKSAKLLSFRLGKVCLSFPS